MLTDTQARIAEIEDYIARASAQIAETDALYGGHGALIHQNGAANIAIMEAQHHETRIAELQRELAALRP